MVARGEGLAGCVTELKELEALCNDDDIDAGTVFKTVAQMPVICKGKTPTKHSKIVDLRMALQKHPGPRTSGCPRTAQAPHYKDAKNVRGLEADRECHTKILAWDEGKEHSWTTNPEEGTSCRNKAMKGSTDFADYIME
ncbi:hypothetical protein HDU86_004747 [Geranomyces michiganensis]|nr:hypothetical protein HDU86_004747 [Geranomyces michiganensis]